EPIAGAPVVASRRNNAVVARGEGAGDRHHLTGIALTYRRVWSERIDKGHGGFRLAGGHWRRRNRSFPLPLRESGESRRDGERASEHGERSGAQKEPCECLLSR